MCLSKILSFLRRVIMFARSVIHNPDIILLDEPTANVDPKFRSIIWDYVCNYLNKSIFLQLIISMLKITQIE